MLETEAPRVSRRSANECGEVFSPTHWPPIPTSITPRTHFCQKLSGPQGHNAAGRLKTMKNRNDPIGNWTPTFRLVAVPQRTAPPRTSLKWSIQGAYKLSEDFAKTIFSQILNRNTWYYYHMKEECLRPTTSKDTARIARAHQHCNRERHTRHAWEGLAGIGVSPGRLPCHTWGAHRMHLRSLWNCKHSYLKW